MKRKYNKKVTAAALLIVLLLSISGLIYTLLPKCGTGITSRHIISELQSETGPGNQPPQNPFLADSSYAIGHGNSAQQDSVVQKGPEGPAKTISPDDFTYTSSGPFQFGQFTSGKYEDGSRVLWGSGSDRIVKLDYESHEVIDTYQLREDLFYSPERGEDIISSLNSKSLISSYIYVLKDLAPMLMDLSGVYTLLDRDNEFYVGGKIAGTDRQGITVYGDAVKGDSRSGIAVKRQFILPDSAKGTMVGMNMTFDGRIVIATEKGSVLVVKKDFSGYETALMRYSEQAEKDVLNGYGWVRNTFAVDKEGGIYIVSENHMHKLVWNGSRISQDAEDGAWVARYGNSRGNGSGATPSLMGFDGEDEFVLITDGDNLMNIVLYWRNEIPDDWKQIPGTSSRRVAGILPADMGGLVEEVQSEQSVIVMGYGAVVVNNEPQNMPGWLRKIDPRISALIAGFIGNRSCVKPLGIQKFQWNPQLQRLEKSWITTEISSLNALPLASYSSNMLYTVGARDGTYTLEAINWETGESAFHWMLGDHQFNTLFSGILIDEDSRIHYTSLWGKIRFE